MLPITDFAVDEADDIIIQNGDFILEGDIYKACIQTAERRSAAREDTFMIDDINAGLEKLIYQHIDSAKSDIIYELTRVLKADGLLDSTDFEIKVTEDTDKKRLQVFVKITSPYYTESEGYRVLIDQLNQISFR